jgi:uncharacterized membrane protein YfcA
MDCMIEIILIAFLIFAAAMLYSSVGHGGASGYLAVMALFVFAPATMRPTALILNICVSSIAAVKFARMGYFSWQKFYPFALASIPFAFIGGSLSLPPHFFNAAIGIVLIVAAILLARRDTADRKLESQVEKEAIPLPYAFVCGSGLGLLSGLTGVGGGIFLSPLLLFMKWTDVRQTAAISAMFILVNSIAGLTACFGQASLASFPSVSVLIAFGATAVAGGTIGASFGSSQHQSSLALRRLLAVVLAIAGTKMMVA